MGERWVGREERESSERRMPGRVVKPTRAVHGGKWLARVGGPGGMA